MIHSCFERLRYLQSKKWSPFFLNFINNVLSISVNFVVDETSNTTNLNSKCYGIVMVRLIW